MKRLPRDLIRFDVMNTFAEFGRVEKLSLRDPTAADGFVERVRSSIQKSMSNDRFLHGIRTEQMFGSLVASLGEIEILKQEDSGEIYASDDSLKIPDYRLVFADGSHKLVEVKNFYQGDAGMRSYEVDRNYLDGLIRYSRLMKCDLFLAIYWALWNIWTVVPPEVFKDEGEVRALSMGEAMKANHIGVLGDLTIGSRFPLSLILHTDQTKPRSIDKDGSATFTIERSEIFCGGTLIQDAVERRIATFLMFYGSWRYEEHPRIVGNEIESVEHVWMPEENHNQGFEMVGSLSEMFSNWYKLFTEDEGEMARLHLDITPGSWGTIIPKDYKSGTLPLWRVKQLPASPGQKPEDIFDK